MAGRSPMPLTIQRASTSSSSARGSRRAAIVAHHRVLQGHDAAFLDQPRDRRRSQVAGRLDVDHGRLGQRVCEAPHAIRQAIVRVREGHGQQHRRGKSASAQHRGLVHHLAVVRPRRRQDPGVGTGQRGQHIHDARVLAQPHVVEVGVAAVHDAAHAAGLQMRQQRPVRSLVQRQVRARSGGTAMTERRRSWWVTGEVFMGGSGQVRLSDDQGRHSILD